MMQSCFVKDEWDELWDLMRWGLTDPLGWIIEGLFILLLIIAVLFVIGFIFIIKKKKKLGGVLIGLSGLLTVSLTAGIIAYFVPEKTSFKTPNGVSYIPEIKLEQFERSMSNAETLEKLLRRYPDLIYYGFENGEDSLNRAAASDNIEACKLFIKYGASFDNEYSLEYLTHSNALEHYFKSVGYSRGNEQTVDTVGFMIENGAAVNYPDNSENPNALFSAIEWVTDDTMVDTAEVNLIRLLIDSGADTKAVNSNDKTPLELFKSCEEGYDMYENDNTKEIEKILK